MVDLAVKGERPPSLDDRGCGRDSYLDPHVATVSMLANGVLRFVIRADLERLPVTPDLIAAFKRRQLSRIDGDRWRQFFTLMYDAMPYPAIASAA